MHIAYFMVKLWSVLKQFIQVTDWLIKQEEKRSMGSCVTSFYSGNKQLVTFLLSTFMPLSFLKCVSWQFLLDFFVKSWQSYLQVVNLRRNDCAAIFESVFFVSNFFFHPVFITMLYHIFESAFIFHFHVQEG